MARRMARGRMASTNAAYWFLYTKGPNVCVSETSNHQNTRPRGDVRAVKIETTPSIVVKARVALRNRLRCCGVRFRSRASENAIRLVIQLRVESSVVN